jgi:heme-degrading monooxygenase HmoA
MLEGHDHRGGNGMFARLVSAQAVDGKLDEAVRIWKEEDMPLMDSVKGYLGAYLLADRESGKAVSMTLWEREEDSVADVGSQLHQKQLGMYEGLLVGEPIHKGYEILARDRV